MQVSINKANFAIFDWFKAAFAPRFTDANAQLKELYCVDDPDLYAKHLVKPAGRIDLQAIEVEKEGIDQIVATLALKDMTQAALIRKICTYSTSNPTRRAVFEYDKLIRSIYTLRYLRDPQLQRNVHRSQNRLESYGNPPVKPLAREVEISRREFLHEEVQVFRQPDHGCAQTR
ncbi:hypothetical protein AT984_04395 [Paucibacter sp. KCTC 42545]|nr:hypothetical protein AT984_04395 [Paucibacter sp. KCTC 42545]